MDIIAISILAVAVIAATVYKSKQDHDNLVDYTKRIIALTIESTTRHQKDLEKLQVEHFKNLEKHALNQIKILEEQSKEFIKQTKSNSVERAISNFGPITKNDISKEEIEEIPLTEDMRMPIVDGLKFKFEGEEQIFPNEYDA